MGLEEKFKNTVDKLTGVAKEKIADVTDDDTKKVEGKVDQSKADVKQSGEHIKDAATDAGKAVGQ
jgi:uncharacterized protein YjbJ (UPF0337 family)